MSGWAQCRCIFSSVCRVGAYMYFVSHHVSGNERKMRAKKKLALVAYMAHGNFPTSVCKYGSMSAWRCYLCGFFNTLWQDNNTNTYAHIAHRIHRRPWPVFRFLVVSSVRLFTQPQLSHVSYDFCSVLLCMAYLIISVFRCRLFFSCARVKFNGLIWRVPIELLCFQITNNNRIQFISSWCQ